MPQLLQGPDINSALAEWAASMIPHVGSGAAFGPCQAFAIMPDGYQQGDEPYGVLVFHDWQEAARVMQITVAATSPRWVFGIKPLFAYVFDRVKANKVFTATPHMHTQALRWNHGIGFRKDATLRHHFGPGVHAVIYSMLESEYRNSYWCKSEPERVLAEKLAAAA